MNKRLPPLNAVRVFEATSRLSSAKLAAAELHVTPAAVSHQIKLLESHLGLPLFKRMNRQLILTEAGQRYAAILHKLFQQLTEETQKLTKNLRSLLTITVEPAFAIYWLLPRIDQFKKLYPQIELRIAAGYERVDLIKSDVDIGIRWGKGQYPGLSSILLFHNELYPVCSPALLKKKRLRHPNDLKKYILLHETTAIAQPDYPDWRDWLRLAGATEVNSETGLYFETGYLLIQAAIDGQGVALERHALVAPAIKAGKLVQIFDLPIRETVNGYYLVFPTSRQNDTKIQAFLNWLKTEINNR
jgi:LysR family transcriptional regulator, glycine cleavage system transcriptional activator